MKRSLYQHTRLKYQQVKCSSLSLDQAELGSQIN
jgi:hypothetical protein